MLIKFAMEKVTFLYQTLIQSWTLAELQDLNVMRSKYNINKK